MEAYQTIAKEASAEFVEKKSRFLCHLAPVSDESEAKAYIAKIKQKHPDATHNVYAYILRGTGIARFSDDGEPQGTAGMPVLETLSRAKISGAVCVVTRYYGGTLLGAGGLVRAYAKAARIALEQAEIALYVPFVTFTLVVGYSDYEKLQRGFDNYSARLSDVRYTEHVTLFLSIEKNNFDGFIQHALDITTGKAAWTVTGERFEAKDPR